MCIGRVRESNHSTMRTQLVVEIAGDATGIFSSFGPSNSHSIMVSQDFSDRPIKKLVLFDVDGTLTPARQVYLFRFYHPEH